MNSCSNKTSNQSRHAGLLRSIGWLMVVGIIVLSLIQLPSFPETMPGSDKLLHLVSYFWLSYWFFHTYFKHKLTVIIGFVLLGLGLEVLQFLTPYRFLEWLDMLMNTGGVLLAYVVFYLIRFRIKWLLLG